MTPDDVEAIAAQAYVEMLEAGFAAVGEFHYLHHDPDGAPYANRAEMAARIVAAARETGIGLTLLPVFYAHAAFGGAPPKPEQRRFVNDRRLLRRACSRTAAGSSRTAGEALGVAPHTLRAATPEELAGVVALAGDGPIHIHVAEQTKEVEDCVAWLGARPVRWLLDHAGVDHRWCLVHATHMDEGEIARSARPRARSPASARSPRPISATAYSTRAAFLRRRRTLRRRVGLQRPIAAARELRQLEYAQRLGRQGPQRHGAARRLDRPGAVRGRWAGGAQALGRRCGRARASARAPTSCR